MKFEFTEQEVNLILQCVAKQPFEMVFQLITSIQKQAQNQPSGNVADPAKE